MITFVVAYFLHQFIIPPTDTVEVHSSVHQEVQGHLSATVQTVQQSSIVAGASRIPVARIHVRADCIAPVVVDTISLQRRGLGQHADIEAIYAMEGVHRISSARSIGNRDGTLDLPLRNVRIEPCQQKEIVLMIDLSSDASPVGQHYFSILAIQAGRATVQLEHIGTLDATETVGGSIGSIDVQYRNLLRNPRYGSSQVVSRIVLSADHQDDHLLHAITFTNEGSASDSDLQNLYLEFQGSAATGVTESLSQDRVRLEFIPPLFIEKNHDKLLQLRADVRASRTKTIQFLIEANSDIESEIVRGR